MWTPKRIVLLAAGFVVFLVGYFGYSSLLGGIDGLPPLPERYLSKAEFAGLTGGGSPIRHSSIEDKLKAVFGPDCVELNHRYKLELHAKRALLTSENFEIDDQGRLHLAPLSLALYGTEKGDGKPPEINTLCADQAYLTFDRPVSNIGEIGNRRIIAAELYDHIKVRNNHRTAARDDDLQVYINHGPVYYDEPKHLIWTKDDVYVKDDQSKPKPTEIRGHGMDMELMSEEPSNKPGVRKARSSNVSGVKSIVLHSDVEMNLYVDGQSGFLGGQREQTGKPAAAAKTPAGPPEKAHVRIKTPGAFHYEIFKDHDLARFDVPEGTLALKNSPQDVVASRFHESLGEVDQLVCKHLELRLRRKESGKDSAGAASSSPDKNMEIETAHATGPDGLVTLTSDAEKLRASGSDFFYDTRKMLTVLKGQPMMEAEKDHNVIRARELQIQDHRPTEPGARAFQTATGIGPGTVDLIDKDSHHEGADSAPYRKVIRAAWRDKLVTTKDGPNDVFIFTGAASFQDYEHNQTLSADTLKVWLQPGSGGGFGASPAPAGAKSQPTDKAPRPERLEAKGNVSARSAEMNIHDTGRLVVWFKDLPMVAKLPAAVMPVVGPLKPQLPPALTASFTRPLPTGPSSPPPAPGPTAVLAIGRPLPATTAGPTLAGPTLAGPPKPGEPPRPIDLSAHTVEAWVLRAEGRNTLDKLWTEGKVRVHQAPAHPDEKGVDVAGETLQMNCHPAGNVLVVTGDLAELQMDKIYIIGPEVNIDQSINKAWVTGAGGMKMESKTNFQGDQLAKPVPLEVTWQKSMFFDGNYAEFHEGVQAEQEEAKMLCQRLDVYFDRPISLKEGAKGDQPPARVKSLMCDKNVDIREETKQGATLVKYQQLTSPAVKMEALEPDDDTPPPNGTPPANAGNEVRASGAGTLRIWQAGALNSADTKGGTPAPRVPSTGGKSDEKKLTYVAFESNMYANSKKNKADFYVNVRVLSFPCPDPRITIDLDVMLDKLPPGGMYLRCDQLEVLNRPVKGGKGHQEMTALGHVTVQSDKIIGHAVKVTYNEEKDQLIFDGGDDGYATLNKVEIAGQEPKKVEAKKIIYVRKTGEYTTEGVRSLSGGS